MTPNNYPEGLDELAEELDAKFKPQWASDAARALLDALAERGIVWVDAKKQEPVAILERYPAKCRLRVTFEDAVTELTEGDYLLYTHPAIPGRVAEPEIDFFHDACRLALELECLLLDCRDTSVTAKWWESAHEALEQHRETIRAMEASNG